MAFTRVQGNAAEHGGSTQSTLSVTISAVGSGNCICGYVTWDITNGATLSSVTDNQGNTYNLETTVLSSLDGQKMCAFSRTNITNGPVTITATLSVAEDSLQIIVDEFSGGSTASSDERDGSAHGGQVQNSPGTGTDAVTSGTFTTTVDGDLLWGGCLDSSGTKVFCSNGTSFSTGTQQTATFFVGQSEYRTQTTAGSGTAATLTQAADARRVTFLIAIKPAAGGGATLNTAWFRPSEDRLPRKFQAETRAAIALTPATPTPTISGMAWFEPPDRDKVPVKVRVESLPALALTPATLPPKIAGMAWFEPLDNYPPRALGKSEPHSFCLGPTTPPTPISGMAWFAPPDRDRPAIKVSVEATPAWSPQVITPAVTAPLTGWWTNSDTVVRCGRRADDPSLIPFTPPQPVLWWSPEDCKPRAQRPLSDLPALSLRDTFQIAGIAWFEPPPDLPRRAAPYREQIAAICLTPPAPPVGISGMAWFAPLDRDRPKYRPTVEASPGWGPHFIAQVAPTPNKAEWLIRARRRGRR